MDSLASGRDPFPEKGRLGSTVAKKRTLLRYSREQARRNEELSGIAAFSAERTAMVDFAGFRMAVFSDVTSTAERVQLESESAA